MDEMIKKFLLSEGSGRIIRRMASKANGERGIYDTVRMIGSYVRICKLSPRIRTEAVRVISRLDDRSGGRAADAAAIWHYLKRRIKYVPDPAGVECLQTPRYTMRHGGGDCDDLTILYRSYAESVGVRTASRIAGRSGVWSHIFPVAWTGKIWLPMDLTLQAPGVWQSGRYDMVKDFP